MRRWSRELPEREEKMSLAAKVLVALLFVTWVGEAPVSVDPVLYNGNWRSPFVLLGWVFVPIPGIKLTTLQLVMVLMLPFCLSAKRARFHARELDRGIVVSVICIAATVLWGLATGGSAYFAYYQVWRFLLALALAFMLMSAIKRERDLYLIGRSLVIAAVIRAILCIYYYWKYLAGEEGLVWEYVTNHDDSILFITAVEILLVWALLKGGRWRWTMAIGIVLLILYAVVLNDRRIAWVELVFGIPALYLLLGPCELRRRLTRWGIIACIPLAAYVGAGMFSNHAMFAPVHALLSTSDYSDNSSVAREEENRNLLRTLTDHGNPLTGTGWGNPYAMVERVYNNYDEAWVLAPYTPHNSLIGLAVYSGYIGLLGMWGLVPLTAWLAARGYRRRPDSGLIQASAIVSIGLLCTYSVHCYGDIGLQSLPASVMLGAAMGVAGRIAMWEASEMEGKDRFVGARTPAGQSAGRLLSRRRAGRGKVSNRKVH